MSAEVGADPLALPIRARLFDALLALGRAATTGELAVTVGRHPNTVRVQLRQLERAGLLERRTATLAIGREVAPDPAGRDAGEAIRHALDRLGFAPSTETRPGGICFVLAHCPYRDAARENQAVVCTLHRGITRGLLDRLAPHAQLTGFLAKDPDTAGCEITVATV